MKTLAKMTEEIREVNIAKGFRSAEGGPGANTFGDYIALLHSEVSEALEAYRDHRLADATRPICGRAAGGQDPCPEHGPSKPEGVGSEFADVLIRLLDMADVFGVVPFEMDLELADVAPLWPGDLADMQSFGDHLSWLHCMVVNLTEASNGAWPELLRALVTVADRFEIDLTAEYERKIAYNRTRAFQHGGRTLADHS